MNHVMDSLCHVFSVDYKDEGFCGRNTRWSLQEAGCSVMEHDYYKENYLNMSSFPVILLQDNLSAV